MNPIALIKSVADAIASVFTYVRDRQALKNSAAMESRQEKQNEQQAIDKTNKSIAQRDVAEIQKELSE